MYPLVKFSVKDIILDLRLFDAWKKWKTPFSQMMVICNGKKGKNKSPTQQMPYLDVGGG